MNILPRLCLNPVPHPDGRVRRACLGGAPYLERCWVPVIGPKSVLLLRRASAQWREQAPASVAVLELSASLTFGLGTSRRNPLRHARADVRFGVAAWSDPGELDVYTKVPPLSPRRLARMPTWTSGLDRLQRRPADLGPPDDRHRAHHTNPSRPDRGGRTRHRVPHERHQGRRTSPSEPLVP